MPHQCTNCGRTFADGSKEMLSGCPDCGGNKFQFRPASATDSVQSGNESGDVSRDAQSPPTDSVDESRPDASGTTSWPNTPDADETPSNDGLTDAAARAGAAVRDRLSRTGGDEPQAESSRGTEEDLDDADSVAEDSAQATARSDVVSREELSAAAQDVESGPSSATPDPETTPDAVERDDVSEHDGASGASDSEDSSATAETSTADTPSETAADAPSETVADTSSEDDQPDLTELRQELNDQFESIKIVSPGQYELNLMELYDRDEYIISLQEDGRYVIEVPDRWREDE